ncbi:MAG TPA: hypothetical protein VNB94_05510 [Mycobacteriales bacterium]|nr:hypothetical protein [Mycobacteriales bacterium]
MRRTIGVAVLGLLALLPVNADAAPSPQLVDPAGDTPVASGDILSAQLSVLGRPGRESLVIEVKYAGSVTDTLPYTRGLTFTVGGCKFSAVQYSLSNPMPFGQSQVGCATGESEGRTGTMSAAGSVLVFRVRLDGKDLRLGAQVTKLAAYTHPGGLFSLHTPLTAAGDVAEGREWVISR